MLHYLDNLDSKMESMRAHFEREAASDGPWTGYNSSLSRPLLNSAKFLEKKQPVARPPDPSAASEASASPELEQPVTEAQPVEIKEP
jgi:3'-5' exoribonuclease